MKTTCYLQIEPEFGDYSYNRDKLQAIHVRRVTKKRPDNPIGGSVVLRLSLDIADAAFLPLTPEATVVVPVEHTEAVVVESEPVEILP